MSHYISYIIFHDIEARTMFGAMGQDVVQRGAQVVHAMVECGGSVHAAYVVYWFSCIC